MHQLLTNRAQSGIRDQIRHPFRKIKEKERLVSLPKALFRADWPSSHVRGQSPSKRSVWFCVSDKCKDVRREWDCGWFIGWGCAVCRQCTHLQICTRRSLEAKEEAESYSLVAGTPSTSIDLLETFVFRKTVFFALFQKGSLWSPASGIKVQSKKMKNMLRTKKESLAINDMWREKIFQKWTKFWRIRWTFLLCFSEILYIASAMSSWSALYQNGNKGRKRRKNQVVASLTSLSQQSRINHHASPSRQLMFNIRLQEGAAELGEEEESEVVEVRRDPAWTCLTSSAPWALLLLREGFQGKKENVQWFVFYRKLGPRWVIQVGTSLGILSSITGGCVLSDIRKTVLASTVYTRIFPGFTDPNNRNFI